MLGSFLPIVESKPIAPDYARVKAPSERPDIAGEPQGRDARGLDSRSEFDRVVDTSAAPTDAESTIDAGHDAVSKEGEETAPPAEPADDPDRDEDSSPSHVAVVSGWFSAPIALFAVREGPAPLAHPGTSGDQITSGLPPTTAAGSAATTSRPPGAAELPGATQEAAPALASSSSGLVESPAQFETAVPPDSRRNNPGTTSSAAIDAAVGQDTLGTVIAQSVGVTDSGATIESAAGAAWNPVVLKHGSAQEVEPSVGSVPAEPSSEGSEGSVANELTGVISDWMGDERAADRRTSHGESFGNATTLFGSDESAEAFESIRSAADQEAGDRGAAARLTSLEFVANNGSETRLAGPVALESLVGANLRQVASDARPGGTAAEQIHGEIAARVQMTQREGRTDFRMRLDPPGLGSVEVHLTASEQSISARLVVSDEAARQAIESHLQSLRESLASVGVSLERFDVTRDDRGSHAAWQRPDESVPRALGSGKSATRARGPVTRASHGRVDLLA